MSVRCIMRSALGLHLNKLQVVHALSNRVERCACNFVVSLWKYWLKIQTCRTNFWWVMRYIFICMVQLISKTFDTDQLQVLTNFINAPLMTKYLPYGALFGPEKSLDPTSLRMKTEKPSQSHCSVIQRWSMNFFPRIFHPKTVHCGFNKMVLWPTRQWLASLRFAVCFRSGWFLVSVRCHALLVRRTSQLQTFFCGVIWKVKCTVLALHTYTHSKKTYGKKSPNIQKKHFKPLCAPS